MSSYKNFFNEHFKYFESNPNLATSILSEAQVNFHEDSIKALFVVMAQGNVCRLCLALGFYVKQIILTMSAKSVVTAF